MANIQSKDYIEENGVLGGLMANATAQPTMINIFRRTRPYPFNPGRGITPAITPTQVIICARIFLMIEPGQEESVYIGNPQQYATMSNGRTAPNFQVLDSSTSTAVTITFPMGTTGNLQDPSISFPAGVPAGGHTVWAYLNTFADWVRTNIMHVWDGRQVVDPGDSAVKTFTFLDSNNNSGLEVIPVFPTLIGGSTQADFFELATFQDSSGNVITRNFGPSPRQLLMSSPTYPNGQPTTLNRTIFGSRGFPQNRAGWNQNILTNIINQPATRNAGIQEILISVGSGGRAHIDEGARITGYFDINDMVSYSPLTWSGAQLITTSPSSGSNINITVPDLNGHDNVAAHEFGHILGLADRYHNYQSISQLSRRATYASGPVRNYDVITSMSGGGLNLSIFQGLNLSSADLQHRDPSGTNNDYITSVEFFEFFFRAEFKRKLIQLINFLMTFTDATTASRPYYFYGLQHVDDEKTQLLLDSDGNWSFEGDFGFKQACRCLFRLLIWPAPSRDIQQPIFEKKPFQRNDNATTIVINRIKTFLRSATSPLRRTGQAYDRQTLRGRQANFAFRAYFSIHRRQGWRHVNFIWLLDELMAEYGGRNLLLAYMTQEISRVAGSWNENSLMHINTPNFDSQHIPNNNLMSSQADKAFRTNAGPDLWCQEKYNQPLNPTFGTTKPPIGIGLTQEQLRISAGMNRTTGGRVLNEQLPWIDGQKTFLFELWGFPDNVNLANPIPAPILNSEVLPNTPTGPIVLDSSQPNTPPFSINSWANLTMRFSPITNQPNEESPLHLNSIFLGFALRTSDFSPTNPLGGSVGAGTPDGPLVLSPNAQGIAQYRDITAALTQRAANLGRLDNVFNPTHLKGVYHQQRPRIIGRRSRRVYEEMIPLRLSVDDGFTSYGSWDDTTGGANTINDNQNPWFKANKLFMDMLTGLFN